MGKIWPVWGTVRKLLLDGEMPCRGECHVKAVNMKGAGYKYDPSDCP